MSLSLHLTPPTREPFSDLPLSLLLAAESNELIDSLLVSDRNIKELCSYPRETVCPNDGAGWRVVSLASSRDISEFGR